MCEVFDYIFGSLKSSETAVKSIQKTLRYQKGFNRNITMLAWAVTVYVVVNELDRREQNKKIKELSNEIKELKRSEGE